MRNKKIGIVSLGYAWLPCEAGPSRFYYIARMLSEEGYDVDLIGSSFQHFKKEPRDKKRILSQNYPFKITFIDVPPYKRNIDIRRVLSNREAAKNVMKYIVKHRYDLIYCSIPANNISAKVGAYCKKKHIPFIVDVEDLWPEAMEMVIKIPVIKRFIFAPFLRDAERTYSCADAVIGTSDEYTNRAFKYQDRNVLRETVYVGCDLDVFDAGAASHINDIEKDKDGFWVTYAGSIGASYDIRTLVQAAGLLLKEGYENIRIKILGTGPLKEELEQMSQKQGCRNVEFLGYTKYPLMAAYLKKSNILINSFVKGAPQSIVNKVGDYLAAGKPVINTLENPEFMGIVERNRIGVNIEPENAELLAETIERLYEDIHACQFMGENARKLGENRFDRKRSYQKIIEVADQLIGQDGYNRNG